MDLQFVEEEIPKIVRQGGSGREAEKWEEHLAPLKNSQGKSFRVWSYDKRTSAVSRMSTVRDRLNKATPHDNWEMKVRPVPNSENFGVYVQYNGLFTDAQVAENAKKREARSSRTSAALAGRSATPPVDEPKAAQSPKERVAAANRKAS